MEPMTAAQYLAPELVVIDTHYYHLVDVFWNWCCVNVYCRP